MIRCCECRYSYPNASGGLWCWEKRNAKDDDSCDKGERIGGQNDNMSVCIGHYDHDYKQWYEDRNWFAKCLYDGLYWCEMPPLPEPYREEGD